MTRSPRLRRPYLAAAALLAAGALSPPAAATYAVHDSSNLAENAATVSELSQILAQAMIDASVSTITQEATGLPGPLGGLVRSPANSRVLPMGAASSAALGSADGFGTSAGVPSGADLALTSTGIPGIAGDVIALGVDTSTTGTSVIDAVLSLVAQASMRNAGANQLLSVENSLRGGSNQPTQTQQALEIIQALLPLIDKLLSRGVGQSAVLGGMAPTVTGPWQGSGSQAYLGSPGTAVAYSRGVFALPETMRGSVGAPLANQMARVRQDELANAIHDAHGAALFSLESVTRHGAARIEDVGAAALEAENLRSQVAVLTTAVLQLTEEVQGLRALSAAQLRMDAAAAMAERGADPNGLLVPVQGRQ